MAKKEKEDEFEILLRDKQHNETIAALRNLASAVSKDNTSERLTRHEKTIEALINSVRQIKPSVNIDQSSVIRSVEQLAATLSGQIQELKAEPVKKWEFQIERNMGGYIEKVIAKAK